MVAFKAKEYPVPVKQAFAVIRDMLAEDSYGYGRQWRVITADTQAMYVVANMHFLGPELFKDEKAERFLEVRTKLKDTVRDSVIIEPEFNWSIDGLNQHACEWIIDQFLKDLETNLGPGQQVESTGNGGNTPNYVLQTEPVPKWVKNLVWLFWAFVVLFAIHLFWR